MNLLFFFINFFLKYMNSEISGKVKFIATFNFLRLVNFFYKTNNLFQVVFR